MSPTWCSRSGEPRWPKCRRLGLGCPCKGQRRGALEELLLATRMDPVLRPYIHDNLLNRVPASHLAFIPQNHKLKFKREIKALLATSTMKETYLGQMQLNGSLTVPSPCAILHPGGLAAASLAPPPGSPRVPHCTTLYRMTVWPPGLLFSRPPGQTGTSWQSDRCFRCPVGGGEGEEDPLGDILSSKCNLLF